MKNGLILACKLEYMDVIKILGLVKSFAFMMWCICGAFYQKWIDLSNKGLFNPYMVSKKYKMALFWPKIGINGCDQNIGSGEKFCLCDVVHLWCLLSKMDR